MFINWQQIKVQSPLRFDLGNFRSHRTTTELYSRFRVGPKRKFTTVNIKRTQHHCIFLYHVIYVHEGYKRWRTSFHSLFLWDTVTLSSGPASSLESDSTSKMVSLLTPTKKDDRKGHVRKTLSINPTIWQNTKCLIWTKLLSNFSETEYYQYLQLFCRFLKHTGCLNLIGSNDTQKGMLCHHTVLGAFMIIISFLVTLEWI